MTEQTEPKYAYILVSTYQRRTDHYGGRITDWDIHDVFSDANKAQEAMVTADTTGPSVKEWKRTYSLVRREIVD